MKRSWALEYTDRMLLPSQGASSWAMMTRTLVLSPKGLRSRRLVSSWAATSSPPEVVGRLEKIGILYAIEYSFRIVLGHHLLPLNSGFSAAGNVL